MTAKEAKFFFQHFLVNFVRWDKTGFPFQRGVCLRFYGIPLHAWNESFFKLCVFYCGQYMRTDNVALDKELFDYAQVLVATSSLEIVNVLEKLLVDGIVVEVKIVEDWGFNIGEDACLFEEVDGHSEHSDNEENHVDQEACNNVDTFVGKIIEHLHAPKGDGDFEQALSEKAEQDGEQVGVSPTVSCAASIVLITIPEGVDPGLGAPVEEDTPKFLSSAEPPSVEIPPKPIVLRKKVMRTRHMGSCPPVGRRSTRPGWCGAE